MKLTKYLAAALLLIPPAALAAPASGDKDKDEVNRIENAGTVMEEILNVPDDIPQDLLNKARCVAAKALNVQVNPQFGRLDYSQVAVVAAPGIVSLPAGPAKAPSKSGLTPAC